MVLLHEFEHTFLCLNYYYKFLGYGFPIFQDDFVRFEQVQ